MQKTEEIQIIQLDNLEIPDLPFNREINREWVEQLVETGAVEEWPPLIVEEHSDGGFGLISGQHRVAAARLLGVTELPAFVRVYENEIDAMIDSVRANRNHGLPLRRSERDELIRTLSRVYSLTYQQIAEIVGCGYGTVARALEKSEDEGEREAGPIDYVKRFVKSVESLIENETSLAGLISDQKNITHRAKKLHSFLKKAKNKERLVAYLENISLSIEDALILLDKEKKKEKRA